jgi:archaellin
MPLQKLIFTKGMNSDTSPEFLPEGESRYSLNVRVLNSENGDDQSAETVKGNAIVTYTLPSGTNTVIGSKEDKKTQKIYYFVHNTTAANCSILEYDSILNTVALVFKDAILNFSRSHLITGINVVELDATKHLLYWTDFYNVPRKINIEKAKYYSAGNYTLGYKTPFDASILPRIKTPPIYPPTYVWDNDSAQEINHLFKRLFQFKVQFVFDDYEVSAWSPISDYVFPVTALPSAVGVPTGEDFETQDNRITLTIPTGSQIVTKIRVAAKELSSTADSINEFDFSLIAEFDKEILQISDDTTYNFYFYNEGNYVTLEVNESTKLFDNVPQLSQSQDIISDNRICDGLVQEGFDPVEIDMRLPVGYTTTVDTNSNSFFPKRSYHKSGGIYDFVIIYYNFANQSGVANITQGKTTEINVNGKFGTTLYIPFVTDSDYALPNPSALNNMQYVPLVNFEIYNAPPVGMTHYQIGRSKNKAMTKWTQFACSNVRYVDINGFDTTPSSAVYFYIYINNIWGRYKQENPLSKLVYDFTPGDRLRIIANNYWTATSPYLPTASTDLDAFLPFNDTEVISFDSGTGIVSCLMTDSLPQNILPGALFEIYTPAHTVINDNELVYEIGEAYALSTDLHNTLIHEGPLENQIIVPMLSSSDLGGGSYQVNVSAGHGFVAGNKVKFYQPSFYSIYGVVTSVTALTIVVDTTGYSIVGFYASGSGTIVKAAEGQFSSGDCFRRYCDMPFSVPSSPTVYRLYSYIETMAASNMFKSNAWDYGRPNRIDPNFRQVIHPSTVRYSERLIPETTINGLSSCFDFNFQEYSEDYGGIYKLWARGQTLVAYQERKIMSIGVLQAVFTDPSTGQRIVGSSTEVLNEQPFYYAGEYGIGKNPESHAFYGEVAYNIDVPRGVCLRLSNDGLTPISDVFNMHNYFSQKCREYLAVSTQLRVYGVFDVRFGEYIISFAGIGNPQSDPYVVGETLAFNEENNAWSTFYSYLPESMCSNGVNIVTFKSGAIYRHNVGTVYNTWYGVAYPSKIWGYCNSNPSNQKVFKAISLESDTGWAMTLETPSGQTTSLLDTNFQYKEGFMYSEILMDDNTPNIVPSPPTLPNARFEGNPMRGQYALVKIQYDGIDYNKIFAMNILWVPSNRSNQ